MDQQLLAALCQCCEPSESKPARPSNRPGLSSLSYRIGTFATFRAAMLEAIAREPALRALTTRQSDDAVITVLELWAALADVLTFYQERLANESFLRTALHRDSVLRLVRLLDYHLRPGLAATTRLAFTADDGALVRIPVGLRVMSTPGQDENPQIFETVESLVADARLNRVPVLPQPKNVNPLAQGRQTVFLTSDNSGWQAAKALNPGDKIVLFGGIGSGGAATTGGSYGEVLGWGVPNRTYVAPQQWSASYNVAQNYQYWASTAISLIFAVVGTPADPNAPEEKELREVRVEGDRFLLVWSKPVTKNIWSANTEARVFTRKLKVFGYDAPPTFAVVTPGANVNIPPTWASHSVSIGLSGGSLPLDASYKDIVVGDELLVYEQNVGAQVVTVAGVAEGEQVLTSTTAFPNNALADHRYRANVTTLSLTAVLNPPISDRRNVNLYQLKGARLPLWTGDFDEMITEGRLCLPATKLDEKGESVEIMRTIEGRELKSGVALRLTDFNVGRTLLLQDHTKQPVVATLTARSVQKFENQDFLVLDVLPAASLQLETRTAVLLGNVAQATHGETVRDEILGDADAATPFQKFMLRKKPLTYVPSARTARGANTLRLLLNGVQWDEAATLYGQAANAQVYTARQNDDGSTVIQFGDGANGARPPSGRGNVIATYRQGSGLVGRLKAEQLNILLDRPVGLKAGLNPAATEGGADPEPLDQARRNAPTTVKTFGRAISLLDFESLVTASGEVAKAKATWVWRGLEKAVHLTVAGQLGGVFSSDALARLHSGLTQQRDPNHVLLLDNFCRVPVVLTAKLTVNDRYVRAEVLAAARQAALSYFAFERLVFAQPLHLSDLYRVLQDVAGVVSVDIDVLHYKGFGVWTAAQLAVRGATDKPVQAHLRLFAARPRPSGATTDPVLAAHYGANPLPEVLPAEQAFLAIEADDLKLTATGGLE